LGGGDGLNLASESAQREAVDARQETSFAPFGFGTSRIGKLAAKDGATRFDLKQGGVDVGLRKTEECGVEETLAGRNVRASRSG